MTNIVLIQFVAAYTDAKPMPLLAALTVLFGTMITAHVTRRTLIYWEIMGISFATLPWGEQVAFLEAAESTWEIVSLFVAQPLTISFLFSACIRLYCRGERGEAEALGAGMLLLVAALVIDMLAESGVLNFVLVSDFG